MPINPTSRLTARMPLADVSNGPKPSTTVQGKKPLTTPDAALDRLLAAHFDLSKLITQVDNLVVRAYKHKLTSELGSNDIESFMSCLSDMHSSLKTWAVRFQKSFKNYASVPVNEVSRPPSEGTLPDQNKECAVLSDGPEEPFMDLAGSPSPLSLWNTFDCDVGIEKQLFLLTPLPKSRAAPSKCPLPSMKDHIEESASNKNTSCVASGLCPLPTASKVLQSGLAVRDEVVPELKKNLSCDTSEIQQPVKTKRISPVKAVKVVKDQPLSLVVQATPLPVKDARGKKIKNRQSTPWAPRDKSIKDMICSELTDLLPPRNSALADATIRNTALPPNKPPNQGLISFNECTPVCKGLQGTVQKGRKAGESTLKRELWTRFEAVSVPGLPLGISLGKAPNKGFLDMLEEVSE